jgi:hypothetical protein
VTAKHPDSSHSAPVEHARPGDLDGSQVGRATEEPTFSRGRKGLPFVDAYSIEANAAPELVWDAAIEGILPRFGGGFGYLAAGRVGEVAARALRAPYPRAASGGSRIPDVIVGFRVERAERPSLIALVGEHRFARYALTLRLEPVAGYSATRLTAETRAVFPGTAGRLYRAAVVGTGAHRLVVGRLLCRVRQLAERG